MTAIAQSFAKVSGLSFIQRFGQSFATFLDRKNVPHWCEYLNEK